MKKDINDCIACRFVMFLQAIIIAVKLIYGIDIDWVYIFIPTYIVALVVLLDIIVTTFRGKSEDDL